ncbi:MAG: acyl-CoA dehydrogenase family protein [Chloroflexi bacterium]|nr:acyl-CoA dehydrogenase family protein [Chloroflexota bacterium]
MFRRFASQEVTPMAREVECDRTVIKETFRKLGEINFFSLALPRSHGGCGESVLSSVVAVEELGRASAGLALLFIENIVAADILAYYCAGPIREKYLGPLLKGEIVGGWGFSEPKGGSHSNAIETTAVRNGSNYRLSGTKVFITGAPIVDVMIVYARTAGNKLTAFLVERNTEGFRFTREEEMMGLQGAACGELQFVDVRLTADNLIGEEGDGVKILNFVAPRAKNYTAAVCLGVTQGVFDCSLEFARQRRVHGASKAGLELVQKRIARIASRLQAARWLVYWGACLQEKGALTNLEASMIKSYLSRVALETAEDGFRIHGSYGYTRSCEVERLYRDAIGLQVTMMANDTNDGIVGAALLDRS